MPMKRLALLWDRENPLTPVGSVVAAIKRIVEVKELTFDEVSHRTLPNGSWEIRPFLEDFRADALLWVEGGPLPADLDQVHCPTACWILSAAHEPTLPGETGACFDLRLVSSLKDAVDGRSRWMPLAAEDGLPLLLEPGLRLFLEDPKPPRQLRVEQRLRGWTPAEPLDRPVAVCLGQGGSPHPRVLDCLRAGAVVVVDEDCDLRGLAMPNEHLERLPAGGDPREFLDALLKDRERLEYRAVRGPAIVSHLHTADLRAAQIRDVLWPCARSLNDTPGSPEVSVLVTCFKYLKRLKICLESLAKQDLPDSGLEVVVADPESPDGLADWLDEFAARHPRLRVVHVPLDALYHRNRGVAINRAFDASAGRIVVSIDGDIVFPPHLIRVLVEELSARPDTVFGVRRAFLPRDATEAVLEGRLDPFQRFQELSESTGDGEEYPFVGVLGYCQAVTREAFARARYPEEFDRVNQSDIVYIERLERHAGVQPRLLTDQVVLHLWHPRNWMGTSEFL